MSRVRILIYEKNSQRTSALREIIEKGGYEARAAFYPAEAETIVKNEQFDLLICGFDNFPVPPSLAKIKSIILAPDGMYHEVDKIARKYKPPLTCITYPFDAGTVTAQIGRAMGVRQTAEAEAIEEDEALIPEMIGGSKAIKKIREMIIISAGVPSTVLILGETGTGKELAANALHRLSPRKKGPYVAVNCAALPESLLETELFGHEKGAFTGADKRRIGKFEAAHNGTLFLDEIGDISPSLQVKLLRVLESKSFYRVGGNTLVVADSRVVCATNQDIFEMADNGTFRRDLLYRINVLTVRLPPLRERPEDIPLLAEHFLEGLSKSYKLKASRFSAKVMKQMKKHKWPGNVRQLQNSIERAVIHGSGKVIDAIDFGGEIHGVADAPEPDRLAELDFAGMKEQVMDFYEREYIAALLTKTRGSIQMVCERSGMDRKTLYRKMKQYGLDKKDFK